VEKMTVTDIELYKGFFGKTKVISVKGRAHHSLSLRLSGDVRFEIDGKKYQSTPNMITFIPAGVSYKTQIVEEGEMIYIHFNTLEDIKEPFFKESTEEMQKIFTELFESYLTNRERRFKIFSLFYSLVDMITAPKEIIPKNIRRVKNFIDKNFSEDISVSSLAESIGISEVYFRNEFKKYFGLSPLLYIKKMRLDKAKQMLSTGYYTVANVATECGFASISYFSYEFKRINGLTPSEYIKKSEN